MIRVARGTVTRACSYPGWYPRRLIAEAMGRTKFAALTSLAIQPRPLAFAPEYLRPRRRLTFLPAHGYAAPGDGIACGREKAIARKQSPEGDRAALSVIHRSCPSQGRRWACEQARGEPMRRGRAAVRRDAPLNGHARWEMRIECGTNRNRSRYGSRPIGIGPSATRPLIFPGQRTPSIGPTPARWHVICGKHPRLTSTISCLGGYARCSIRQEARLSGRRDGD
jgi:hypothetical protein